MPERIAASPASASRGSKGRPHARLGPWAGLAALLLLAACGWFDPPIDPDPKADELFEISAAQSVAAGQVVVAHGAGTRVVLVKALMADMSVSAATSGTSTVVAWVGGSSRSGRQVQIGFAYPSGATQPVVANAKAFAASDGPDLGAGLSLVPTDDATADQEPLDVTGYDHAQDDPGALSADFANYRLGDVNADGVVNALDALRIRELADAGSGSAHEVYHSDLDGDYDTDADDVQRTLDKAVDPELAASLQVKPPGLSYVQLDPDAEGPALVLVANGGNQPLAG